MKKERYIDLMNEAFSAYTDEKISSYTETVIKEGITEHGFPRLTANLGILIAHGKRAEYKNIFQDMMDLCCKEIPSPSERNGEYMGNDFSVKEIVFCLLELEKSKVFPESVLDKWKEQLSKIEPYRIYRVIAKSGADRVGNWAAFGAASEQARKYANLGNEEEFIKTQIASQLLSFDENGMYRDPGQPMLYDYATRLQLALALYLGFDGEISQKLEEELLKSADFTLGMQSVTGEVPYGGRSNQFLHNEATLAAICEFYAVLFKRRGEMDKAKKFKGCATLAIENIIPWLSEKPVRHIKNLYSIDSSYGCEPYAYFDKYMITTASNLYLAYMFADEDIEEDTSARDCICETSKDFHKVFCRKKDYFVEIDTKANPHYDGSGIGRIHKKGAPSAICLSVPFGKDMEYKTDIENPSVLAICGGIEGDYTCEVETDYNLLKREIEDGFISVEFECKTKSGKTLRKKCKVSADGVEVVVLGKGDTDILFPAFEFDGENYTKIFATEKTVQTEYKGYICSYTTDGKMVDKNQVFANRNGHYKCFAATKKDSVSLKIKIDKK